MDPLLHVLGIDISSFGSKRIVLSDCLQSKADPVHVRLLPSLELKAVILHSNIQVWWGQTHLSMMAKFLPVGLYGYQKA